MPEPAFQNKWAFLIGVSEYERVRPLKWAADDAHDLADSLVRHLHFPAENVIVLSDKSPSKPGYENIWHRLGELCARPIGQNDLIVFHYSGHGLRDDRKNEDRILPSGASLHDVEHTGILLTEVVNRLRNTGCHNIVMFLDMCREATPDEGARGITGGPGSATARWVSDREGMATFFSCDPCEFSYEIDDLKHGCFTHCILEAIQDTRITTVGELDKYLRKEVPSLNAKHGKRPQLPRMIPNPHQIEMLAFLELPGALGGGHHELIEKLRVCVEHNQLPPDFFVEAIQALQDEPSNPWDKAKILALKAYCEKKLNLESLRQVFRSKRTLGDSEIQGLGGLGEPPTSDDDTPQPCEGPDDD